MQLTLKTAKKIKADLIEKAKVKKAYHRQLAKQHDTALDSSMLEIRDEGKFAPEKAQNDEEEEKHLARAAARAGPAPNDGVPSREKKRKRARDLGPSETNRAGPRDENAEAESARRIKGGSTAGATIVKKKEEAKSVSVEERKKQRQDRDAKWNAESGSKRGRERGQPNLGNRVGLLLERIKKG